MAGPRTTGVTLAAMLNARVDNLDPRPSHEELGQTWGVTQATATRWLRGSTPKDEHLPRLAEWLGIDVSEVAAASYRQRQQRNVSASRMDDVEAEVNALRQQVAELEQAVARLASVVEQQDDR